MRIKQAVIIIFCMCVFLSLNYWINREMISHSLNNESIANSSHARDESVDAWDILLGQSDFFEQVKSGDIFVSPSNDDAFERNAGDFYAKTGIHLGISLRPVDIWSLECLDDLNCTLSELRPRLAAILKDRLARRKFFPQELIKSIGTDWIDQQVMSENAFRSEIFYFNFIPVGDGIHIAIVAPLQEVQSNSIVNMEQAQLIAISASYTTSSKFVELNGQCLSPSERKKIKFRADEWEILRYPVEARGYIDMRFMSWGLC